MKTLSSSLALAACLLVGCAGADDGGSGSGSPGGNTPSGRGAASSPAPSATTGNPSNPSAPSGGGEGQDPGAGNVTPVPPAPATPGFQALLGEVHRMQVGQKSTKYSHTTLVNEATFTYDVDCSGFINYALARVLPDALQSLVAHYGSRPLAVDYVHMIENHAPEGRWESVSKVTDLVSGDIVTWLEPPNAKTSNTGHVMVVAKTPYLTSASTTDYHVLVIDSTESPHGGSMDIRSTTQTGVGEGIIVLHTNSKGAPTGYYWTNDPSSPLQTTTIVLGHLK